MHGSNGSKERPSTIISDGDKILEIVQQSEWQFVRNEHEYCKCRNKRPYGMAYLIHFLISIFSSN